VQSKKHPLSYFCAKIHVHMLKKSALTVIALSVFTLFLASCGGGANRPDTSGIKVDLKSHRFDKDLYALDTNNLGAGLVKLKEQYPTSWITS
jgi:hypothetical protein